MKNRKKKIKKEISGWWKMSRRKNWRKHGWMERTWGFRDWRLKLGPSEQDSVEFGPDHLQQLRVEKVLTQAEGAPVTSAHAAQAGVAAEENGTHRTQALCWSHPAVEQPSADWNTSCLIQTLPEKGLLMRHLRRNNSTPSGAGAHQRGKPLYTIHTN